MVGFERVRRELIAALQRFKRNCDHTSWPGLYFTIHALHSPKTTLTLFCPRVQSRRQRSTAIRSSTSKAGATSIWPASCCKRRNHHPSSIGEFERSPLTIAQIEFVPRVFRHSRVSRNPNLEWPPFDRICFIEKFQRERRKNESSAMKWISAEVTPRRRWSLESIDLAFALIPEILLCFYIHI